MKSDLNFRFLKSFQKRISTKTVQQVYLIVHVISEILVTYSMSIPFFTRLDVCVFRYLVQFLFNRIAAGILSLVFEILLVSQLGLFWSHDRHFKAGNCVAYSEHWLLFKPLSSVSFHKLCHPFVIYLHNIESRITVIIWITTIVLIQIADSL